MVHFFNGFVDSLRKQQELLYHDYVEITEQFRGFIIEYRHVEVLVMNIGKCTPVTYEAGIKID